MKKILLIFSIMVMVAGFTIGISNYHVIAAENSKYGGILKLNYPQASRNFGDPQNIRGGVHTYSDPCLQGLLRPSNETLGEYDPVLATSWELSPDKSFYTFHLRKGVKFHDGTDFNAKAAKWNLDRQIASTSPTLNVLKSVEIIDEYTIKCNLSSWHSLIINEFSGGGQTMYSPTAFETHDAAWVAIHPVGTGPFRLTKVRPGQICEYEKNPDYWEKGLPYLDGLVYYQIVDYMTASAAMLKGEIDAIQQIDVVTAESMKKKGAIIDKFTAQNSVFVFASNDPNSVWADKRMRMALEYAIDKERLAKTLGRGYIGAIYEIINGIQSVTDPKTVPRTYNPEKAKKLMAEAGYPNGVKVSIKYTHTQAKDYLLAIQSFLAEVGITANVQFEAHGTFVQHMFSPFTGNDLLMEFKRGSAAAMLAGVKQELVSTAAYLPALTRPEGLDQLCKQALQEEDPAKVISLIEQMERLTYENAMYVPVWSNLGMTAYQPYIKDVTWDWGNNPLPHFERTWLDK
ncbi:ABC transporter substrate-binding protein [Thermodesulfobacteriota bacterium]